MRRRTLEEKLEAIRLVEEGNSPRSVSDRLHYNTPDFQTTAQANPTKVCTFAENSKITMGKMSKFTPAFKAKVAKEKKVGYPSFEQFCAIFSLNDDSFMKIKQLNPLRHANY